jgi:hypothetical protein
MQELLVFLRVSRIDEIARDYDDRRPGPQRVESHDAALQRPRRVHYPVGKVTRAFDVQISDLRDQERRAHAGVPGRSRTARGST